MNPTIETIGRGWLDQSLIWYRFRRVIGRPILPPHAVKEQILTEYANGFNTLIETGTYQGHMVEAMRSRFRRIYSIELSPELAKKAADRFSRYTHITILHGDSGKLLPEILEGVQEPCVFWLDGHYSGGKTAMGEQETPVVAELRAILYHPVRHAILIDDARLFEGKRGYPTIGQLLEMLAGTRYTLAVAEDVIRIVTFETG